MQVLRILLTISTTASPTHLWLVRHGESAGNLAHSRAEAAGSPTIEIEGRDVDVPLSELGKFYYRPPGGESWCDIALRLRSVLQDLQANCAGERVLIVAHQVVVLCFRYVLESLDEQRLLEIDRSSDVANCSIASFGTSTASGRARFELLQSDFVAPLEEAGEPVTAAPDPAVIK